MHTQEAMGRFEMLDRLAAQMGSREAAIVVLQKRGHLEADGVTWTAAGAARNEMTAAERAKDRAAKRTGKRASDFTYDFRTNRAKARP